MHTDADYRLSLAYPECNIRFWYCDKCNKEDGGMSDELPDTTAGEGHVPAI